MEWIKFDDQKPPESKPLSIKKVLVWVSKGGWTKEPFVTFGWWNKCLGWRIEGSPSDFSESVHYWMPLPTEPEK